MLVLTRHKNQKIIIGNSIVIIVQDIAGNRVRLGIEAPKDIPVLREELINKNRPPQKEERQVG